MAVPYPTSSTYWGIDMLVFSIPSIFSTSSILVAVRLL
jgi:hypothetical protein